MRNYLSILTAAALVTGLNMHAVHAEELSTEANTSEIEATVDQSVSDEIETLTSAFDINLQNESATPAPEDKAGQKKHGHAGACGNIKLNDAQKAQVRDLAYQFKKDQITLGSKIKLDRLDYKKLATDPKADLASAQASSALIASDVGAKVASRLNFHTTLLFSVATADQRPAVMACMKQIKKMHHHQKMQRSCGRAHKHHHHGDGQKDGNKETA